jgi:hypothetical protein
MSRQLTVLHRTSFAIGALLITWGVAPHAVAADPVQRVAMACTQSSGAAGCAHSAVVHGARHSAANRTANGLAAERPQARHSSDTRAVAAVDSDGTRFLYASCGCSND